jgi:hypothetical protein
LIRASTLNSIRAEIKSQRAKKKPVCQNFPKERHLSRSDLESFRRTGLAQRLLKSRSVRTTSGQPPLPWQPESLGPTDKAQSTIKPFNKTARSCEERASGGVVRGNPLAPWRLDNRFDPIDPSPLGWLIMSTSTENSEENFTSVCRSADQHLD